MAPATGPSHLQDGPQGRGTPRPRDRSPRPCTAGGRAGPGGGGRRAAARPRRGPPWLAVRDFFGEDGW